MSGNNFLNEHGILTEKGRRVLRLILQDPKTAEFSFVTLRRGLLDKIKMVEQTMNKLMKVNINTSRLEELRQILLAETLMQLLTIKGMYSRSIA